MYHLDGSSATPLHVQLYEALKRDITATWAAGHKLPSIRKVAQEYRLSKNTVEGAYHQLYAEGYIESRPRSGYYVAEADHQPLGEPQPAGDGDAPAAPHYRYDFFPARLAPSDFPVKLWKRLFAKAVGEEVDFGAFPNGQGEPGLRREIARYLTLSRGVRCEPSQVVIGGAFVDTIGMIAALLQEEHGAFAVEHPGYHVARQVFAQYRYAIESIGVGANGLCIDELLQSSARIVYITPSHQYPTGAVMPVAHRLQLLAWAKEREGFIIEDDYDSELSYRHRPIPSLQGLDTEDRVIYVGTFSKSLSPALRVGYLVLPHRLMERYRRFHGRYARVALATQKTLELFLRDGHWERHLRKIRNLNRKKHDLMRRALLERLGDSMTIVSKGGGLAINIRPTFTLDREQLRERAEKAGLKLYFAKEFSGGEWEAIRMGFGGFEIEEIEPAVAAFAEVWGAVWKQRLTPRE